MTTRRKIIIGVLIVLALIALRVLTTSSPESSEREKILRVIQETKTAAERKDSGAILQFISSQFRGSGMTRDQLRVFLNQNLRSVTNVQVNYSTPQINIQGNQADVHFDTLTVKFDQTDTPQTYALTNVNLKMQKEEIRRYFILKDSEWHFAAADQIPGAGGLL